MSYVTCQSSDGSLMKMSIIVKSVSEFDLRACSECTMMPSIRPFSRNGSMTLRSCRVSRKGTSSGIGRNCTTQTTIKELERDRFIERAADKINVFRTATQQRLVMHDKTRRTVFRRVANRRTNKGYTPVWPGARQLLI
jgi:hypothetical protein